MKDKPNRPGDAADLRRQAEGLLGEREATDGALSPEQTRQMLHELRVHQIELEMQNEELRRAQVQLEVSQARYFDLYDLAPVGYVTINEGGQVLEANLSAATLLGVTRKDLVKRTLSRFVLKEDQDHYYMHSKALFATGTPQSCELRMLKKDETIFWAQLQATAAQEEENGPPLCRVMLTDITARRLQEEALALTARLIVLVNTPGDFRECMAALTAALQGWSGCEAVGIRLREGDDFPYYETRGFPSEFVEAERSLCAPGPDGKPQCDGDGRPLLECVCGNILSGRLDSGKPFSDAQRSFWSNNTSVLAASIPQNARQEHMRYRCVSEGYQSVALVPLRADGKILGLLQFNDHRPNRFSPDLIDHFENMADSLAIALSRRADGEALRESEARLDLALDAARAASWDWDVVGGHTNWSRQMFDLFGLDPKVCTPSVDLWKSILHPDDVEGAGQRLAQALKDHARLNSDYRIMLPGGGMRWINAVGEGQYDAQGEAVRMVGICMDITERKRMEEAQNFLAKTSSGTTDAPFFDLLARYLAQSLDMDFICIDRLEGDGLSARTLSVWCDGRYEDNVTYALKDTPCGDVVGKEVCCFPASVCQCFPRDQVLQELRAESYIGVTLWGHTGRPIGLIAVIGRRPLANRPLAERILKLVAVRAGGELERLDTEAALRESNELFSLFMQHSPIYCFIKSVTPAESRVLQASDNFQQMTGIPGQRMIGKTMDELFPAGFAEKITADDWSVVAEGRVLELEEDLDGRNYTTIKFPIVQGDRTLLAGFTIDITDRKRAEAALRESTYRLSMALDIGRAGIWEWRLGEDALRFDALFHEMLGYAPGELPTALLDWLPYHHPDDLPVMMSKAEAYLEGKSPTYESEYRIRGKGGEWIWVFTRGQRLISTMTGEPDLFIGIAMNVTDRKRAEEALRASQAKLEAALTSMADAVLISDAAGKLIHFNDAFVAFHRFASRDECSRQVADYPDIIDVFTDAGKPVPLDQRPACRGLRGETATNAEYTLHRKDTGETWIGSYSFSPIHDEAGVIIGSVVVARDITDRKRAEEALRLAHARLQSIVDANIVGVIIASPNGTVLDANDYYLNLIGFTREEFKAGKVDWRAITPPEWLGADAKAIEELRDQGACTPYEKEYLRRDGSRVPVFLADAMLPGPEEQIAAFVLDLTERKRAEDALRESEARFRSYFELPLQGLAITSPEKGWIEVNDRICSLLGYARDELIRKTWSEMTHPEDLAADVGQFERLLTGEIEQYQMEKRFVRKDGTVVWTKLGVGCVRKPDGRVDFVIALLDDITERKQAEEEKHRLEVQLQQAQKMESVGRLAGGVAHDFNNMLAVILGYTEVALGQVGQDDPLHADLEEVFKAATRSADLTRQLLAFARRQTVMPKVLDLNETVAGLLKMLQRLMGENIELRWRPGPNLWPVWVDPSQIDQILANLCVNARDAIADLGTLTVETENRTVDEHCAADHADFVPGDYVLLTVSDDGCGMDKDMLDRIFEPFFTTKEVGKGTGLGLATIYGIVKQNKGFIDVDSEPGQGTTFKIHLPRHVGKPGTAAAEGAPVPIVRGHETVLLVEDEPSFLKLTALMLQRLGYTVLATSSPGEALRMAREQAGEIRLLMTDVVMPEMNGRDLARNLLSLYPQMKRLFMSGYTAEIIAHRGVLDEGTHFIQKPFSTKDLADKVRRVLDSD